MEEIDEEEERMTEREREREEKKREKRVHRLTAKCEFIEHRKLPSSAIVQRYKRPGIKAWWTSLQNVVARSPVHQLVQSVRFDDFPS